MKTEMGDRSLEQRHDHPYFQDTREDAKDFADSRQVGVHVFILTGISGIKNLGRQKTISIEASTRTAIFIMSIKAPLLVAP
jgi:hypothetical protein